MAFDRREESFSWCLKTKRERFCTATGHTAALSKLQRDDYVDARGCFKLAQILEVLIGVATLHEFARRSRHKTDDDFLLL